MAHDFHGLPFDKEVRIPLSWVDHDQTKTREIDQAHVDGIASSFLSKGQQQAIKVRPNGDRLVVTFGEHRLEAAKVLWNKGQHIKRLPAGIIIGEIEETDEHSALELKLTENAQRNPFVNPWEEGKILVRLLSEKYHGDLDELAESLGKANQYLKDRIQVYHMLDENLVPFIGKGLTIQNAIAISKLEGKKEQLDIANNILRSRSQNLMQFQQGRGGSFSGFGGGYAGKTRVRTLCKCEKCGNLHPNAKVEVLVDE